MTTVLETLLQTKTLPKEAILIVMGEDRDPLWRYPGCCLPNVYIRGGINIVSEWIEFHDLQGMHNAIADKVLSAPLNGASFRFLRKELLLTVGEIAHLTNVDSTKLAAWENGGGFAIPAAEEGLRRYYKVWRDTRVRPSVHNTAAA